MAKSVYEIWLSWQNNKEKFRLPVLPSTFEISNSARNASIDIAKLGEVTDILDPASDIISFSSFFPAQYSPLCEYPNPPRPWELRDTIRRWMRSGKPIRLIVTGTPINYAVSIEDFSHKEGDMDIGDLYFSLSLKEYRFTSSRRVEIKQNQVKSTSQRPIVAEKVKTYTVKPRDTLWAIAGKPEIYGKNSEWTKIWNANKDMLVKRDSNNLKKPGHWIYPPQVLKIP